MEWHGNMIDMKLLWLWKIWIVVHDVWHEVYMTLRSVTWCMNDVSGQYGSEWYMNSDQWSEYVKWVISDCALHDWLQKKIRNDMNIVHMFVWCIACDLKCLAIAAKWYWSTDYERVNITEDVGVTDWRTMNGSVSLKYNWL